MYAAASFSLAAATSAFLAASFAATSLSRAALSASLTSLSLAALSASLTSLSLAALSASLSFSGFELKNPLDTPWFSFLAGSPGFTSPVLAVRAPPPGSYT